jgi:hypothetical protein
MTNLVYIMNNGWRLRLIRAMPTEDTAGKSLKEIPYDDNGLLDEM